MKTVVNDVLYKMQHRDHCRKRAVVHFNRLKHWAGLPSTLRAGNGDIPSPTDDQQESNDNLPGVIY